MKPALVLAWVVFVTALSAIVFQGVGWGISIILGEGALLAIGTLLVLRRPGNVIGTILVAMGAVWTLILAADVSIESLADRGHDSAVSWLALVFMIATIPMLWLGNIAIWLVFPQGRPSTISAGRFLRISAGYTVALAVAHVFARPRILSPGEAGYPHPFLDEAVAEGVGEVMDVLVVVLLFFAGFLAAGMLVARSRHSDPTERRQIAWVALGYVLSNALLLLNALGQPLGAGEDRAGIVLDSVAFLFIAVTLGVAIMKYRLFDIDVIISKSVMYLGLLAAITAVYALVVVLPLVVIGASDDEGPGLLLPIVATAVVAVTFEPIRSRMQRWANRLVYGKRSTPYEVLSQLTARLSETGGGGNTDDLARLVAEGTGADQAVVWVERDDLLRPAGMWAAPGADAKMPSPIKRLTSGELVEMADVRHEGERLGAVSILKPSNDPVTPADRELLSDVAAGAALVLRNIALNDELEAWATEVRRSRRRLIEAQDSERHRLERDLHDGAQQQVVALKVKMGIARTIAEREGADDIAARIVALGDDTQHAVDALRVVAHGIYPPLLESEGLAPALRAVERSSVIPVDLDVAGLDRYGRPAEETVYFCVTEALERARMSGATSARVGVAGQNGELVTEIDLGSLTTELDLTAVSDRVDAAGGTFVIENRPNCGPRITGSLPLADLEPEPA